MAHSNPLCEHLVVFTEAEHYQQNGKLLAHSGFVKEMDIWAGFFKKVTVAGIASEENPPADSIEYQARNIEFSPMGKKFDTTKSLGRMQRFLSSVQWFWRTMALGRKASVIMGRGPDSLGVLGAVVGVLLNKPRFAKYTDQIPAYLNEPRGYKVKKWFFRQIFRAPVLIYGQADAKLPHFVPMNLPVTVSQKQWDMAGELIADRQTVAPYEIVFAGRLTEYKRVDVLILAVKQILAEGFPVLLHIIGDGPALKDFQTMANDAGVAEHILFHGWQSHETVLEHYAKGFCLVNCSIRQGIDKTILESMTYALPVITGDVNMSRTIIEPPKYGLIYELDSVESLTDALRQLLKNPELAKSMGSGARAKMESLLIEKLAGRYEVFLREHFAIGRD